MCGYGKKWYADPAAGRRCGAGGAGGGHRSDLEVLPDEAVEETRHEEGGEDGDEEQRWQGFLRNSQ